MASVIASLKATIDADVTGLASGMDTAERKVDGFAGKAQPAFNNVKNAIAQIGATYMSLSVGKDIIDTAIEFESAWVGVEKVVDGTTAELSTLRDTLKNMATDSDNPLSSLEDSFLTLAGIAEIGGQLGIAADDLDEFVQVVGELTMATNLSGDEAATFLGKFSAVTSLPVSKFRDLGDAIVTLGNNFAVTEDQLAKWGLRLAPLAEFDWTPDEILAYGTAMETVGLSPEMGGTNLTKTVTDFTAAIATGRPELEKYASIAGLTVDELTALEDTDPQGAFNAFIAGLAGMDIDDQLQAMEDLNINSVEQQGTLLRLAGTYDTVLTPALDTAADAYEGNNALLKEAETRADSTEGAINSLGNKMTDLKADVGERFLPLINTFVDTTSNALTTLDQLVYVVSFSLENFFNIGRMGFDTLKRGAERAWAGIKITVLTGLASINKALYDATVLNDTLDILPDVNLDLGMMDAINEQQRFLTNMNIADAIVQSLQGGEPIDLSEAIEIEFGDGTKINKKVSDLLTEFGSDDTIAAMSEKGKFVIESAITKAIADSNFDDAQILLDVATELDTFNVETLREDLELAMSGGGDVSSDVSVTPNVTNTADVVSDVETTLESEAYNPLIDAKTEALAEVVNLPGVVSDVIQQLTAQDYSMSITVPVTVTPEYNVTDTGGSKLKDKFTETKTPPVNGNGQGGAPPPPVNGNGQSGNAPPPVVNINVQGTMMGEDELYDAVNKAAKKAGLK